MRRKRQWIASHAALMLRRNVKSYCMLSVIIVLSFSILLGYLAFVDSSTFTNYKEIFATPSNIIMTSTEDKPEVVKALKHMVLQTDPNAKLYQYVEEVTTLTQYGDIGAKISFLPEGNRPVYREITTSSSVNGEYLVWNTAQKVDLVIGRKTFDLHNNEAIINESFYRSLKQEKDLPFYLDVPYRWSDGSYSVFKLFVVGVCADTDYESTIVVNENGIAEGSVHIYTTQAVLDGHTAQDMVLPTHLTWICSQKPEAIVSRIEKLNVVVHAPCNVQRDALSAIRTQTATKAVIAAILLLICGTNLFSSFTNALTDRKFEIGVKRAVGASAWSIVSQFLLEGVMVMLVNLLLSVALVADVLIIYKIARFWIRQEQWIVSISPYSVAMFGVCSVCVTILFSTIFAYMATQVEIGKQLKAE